MVRLLAVSFLLQGGPVDAHEWYPFDCCAEHHCHPIACETLLDRPSGAVMYKPTKTIFFRQKVLPSRDEGCHICTSEPDGSGVPYCVFVQPRVM